MFSLDVYDWLSYACCMSASQLCGRFLGLISPPLDGSMSATSRTHHQGRGLGECKVCRSFPYLVFEGEMVRMPCDVPAVELRFLKGFS